MIFIDLFSFLSSLFAQRQVYHHVVWQFDHFDALFDSVNGSVSSSPPISVVAGWMDGGCGKQQRRQIGADEWATGKTQPMMMMNEFYER